MVHALHEAHRVLAPCGLLVDLRPYCLEIALEVVPAEGNFETAGMLDSSLNRDHDEAADRAMETIEAEGIFQRLSGSSFDIFYYWKSIKGMTSELNANWKDDVILTGAVLNQARALFRRHSPRAQLRLRIPMKLVVYQKS